MRRPMAIRDLEMIAWISSPETSKFVNLTNIPAAHGDHCMSWVRDNLEWIRVRIGKLYGHLFVLHSYGVPPSAGKRTLWIG